MAGRMGAGSKASLKQSLCPFPQEGCETWDGGQTDPHLVKDWVRYGFWFLGKTGWVVAAPVAVRRRKRPTIDLNVPSEAVAATGLHLM